MSILKRTATRETLEDTIKDFVCNLAVKAAIELPDDVLTALKRARDHKEEPRTIHRNYHYKNILDIIIKNALIAREERIPICQDTGIDCVFLELGAGVGGSITFDIYEAINEGIRQGTKKGFLRASVADPVTRANSGDNTPSIIHTDIVKGSDIKISILPKGCGSENMSALFMLSPSVGIEGITDAVVSQVKRAGPNPCPPGIIGVGIGGTMDQCALLAKKALLRPIGVHHERDDIRDLEQRLLSSINRLGIGPLGLGGPITALWVSVEVYPCHIASLPVAVNYQCHAARRATGIISL